MTKLSNQLKTAVIHKTDSPQQIPVLALPEVQTENYFFVSYDAADYKAVYADILRLQECGINIFYDRAMTEEAATQISREYMDRYQCVGVLFYLSENALHSSKVLAEMAFAHACGKKYLAVVLPVSQNEKYTGKVLSPSELGLVAFENGEMLPVEFCALFSEKSPFLSFLADAEEKVAAISAIQNRHVLQYSPFTLYENDSAEQDFASISRLPLPEAGKSPTGIAVNGVSDTLLTEAEIHSNVFSAGRADEHYAPQEGTNEAVNLFSQVRAVDIAAFANCRKLRTLTVPNPLEYFGHCAFLNCSAFLGVDLQKAKTVGAWAFGHCQSLTSANFTELRQLGAFAFAYCTQLSSVSFDSWRFKTLPEGAFCGCTNLKKVQLNYALERIEAQAFKNCMSLTEIFLPKNVTYVAPTAFEGCRALTVRCEADKHSVLFNQFVAPENVSVVWNCKNNNRTEDGKDYVLSGGLRFAVHDGVATVVNQPIDISGEIFVPSRIMVDGFNVSVAGINDKAFLQCEGVTEITLGEGISFVGNRAFDGCRNLKNVNLPSTLKTLGENAFLHCENLQRFYVNPASTYFSALDGNLYNKSRSVFVCYANGEVCNIPEGVLQIGVSAFYGNKTLRKVVLPNTLRVIDNLAFYCCANLSEVVTDSGSMLSTVGRNAFCGCAAIEEMALPASVKCICRRAFFGCFSMKKFEIRGFSRLQKMEFEAFANCYALESFNVPASVQVMDSNAFVSCRALKTVRFDDNCQLAALDNAFCDCPALTDVVFGLNTAIQQLGSHTFYFCGVQRLQIPAKVSFMDKLAVSNCENLQHISFEKGSVLTRFPMEAFSMCGNVEEIDLSNCSNLEFVPQALWTDFRNLRRVLLPKTVQEIAVPSDPATVHINVVVFTGNKAEFYSVTQKSPQGTRLQDICAVMCTDGIVGRYAE